MAFEMEPENDTTPQDLGVLSSGPTGGGSVNLIVQSNGSQSSDTDLFSFSHSVGETLIDFELTIQLTPSGYGGEQSYWETFFIELAPGAGLYGDTVRVEVGRTAGEDRSTHEYSYEESYRVSYSDYSNHEFEHGVNYETDTLDSVTVHWYVDQDHNVGDAKFSIYTDYIITAPDADAIGYSSFEITLGSSVAPTQVSLATLSYGGESGAMSTITASVTLSDDIVGLHPLTEDLTVDWQVVPAFSNSASPEDFAGGEYPSGQVTIEAGQSSASLSFELADDTIVEPNEQFYLVISNPSIEGPSIEIGTASLTGTIFDNDTGPGPDVVTGSDGKDTFDGGRGKDILIGHGGADTLLGGRGDDTLWGGAGKDRLDGGKGADTADYWEKTGAVEVTLDKATLVQVKVGGKAEDKIRNIESVNGGFAGDRLTGDSLANKLKGNAGKDTLIGGGGEDTLVGGMGKDRLEGGTGEDVFVFNVALNRSKVDTIVDFNREDDTIRLDNAVFEALGSRGALKGKAFYKSADGLAHDGSDRIIYETDTGKLFYDEDGTGDAMAVQFAVLRGAPDLGRADFVIV